MNENYVNLSDDFIPNSRKVIFTTDELQNSTNALTARRIENRQIEWNANRSTVSGFPELVSMNQSNGDGTNGDTAKDSTDNEQRKLTR